MLDKTLMKVTKESILKYFIHISFEVEPFKKYILFVNIKKS